MAITKFNDNVNIIQALDNLPNDVGGLSPAQLKAKFDEAAGLIKTYLNNTLTAELEATTDGASGADKIGATAITGLTGTTVQPLLESLKTLVDTKTDKAGDHAGTWQGYTPKAVDATVDGRLDRLEEMAFNVKDYGAKGDGVTDDYTNLYNLTTTTINGADATILFSNGTYRIGSNITFPSNVRLYFTKGAKLAPDAGVTITLNGQIMAGRYEVFTGDGTIASNIFTSEYYPEWFGALADGATNDYTAINKALTAGKNISLSEDKTYAIETALSIGHRQKIKGNNATIQQKTVGEPILKISSSRWKVEDLQLEYATQQTNTGSIGIQLGDVDTGAFEGKLSNLLISNTYAGVKVPNLSGAFAYMIDFELVRTCNAYDWGFDIAGSGNVGLTTNTFKNCYVMQDSKTNGNINSRGFRIANHDDVTLIGCAVDKTQYGIAYSFESCQNANLISCHAESNVMYNYRGLFSFSSSNVNIIGCSAVTNYINVANETYFVRNIGSSLGKINIIGFVEKGTNYTSGTVRSISAESTSADAEIFAKGFKTNGGYGIYDGLGGQFNQIKQFNNTNNHLVLSNKNIKYLSAVPASGTWNQGDIVFNSLPSAGGKIGWVCVTGGSPGGWKTFGAIDA